MFNVQIIEKKKRRNNLLDISLVVNNEYRTILKINPFNCFTKFIIEPAPLSLDILYFTSIIYSIDKLIPRNKSVDNWSRDINVTVPVSNVIAWDGAKNELKKALDFLTSDNWIISFCKIKRTYFQKKKNILPLNANIDSICLFSGGLDSLIGGINLAHEKDSILFISHVDNTGASSKIQQPLLKKIKDTYPKKNIEQSRFHIFADASNEGTTRGRSILFHGLALFHAMNLGIDKIIAPENGVISINLPLTPSRTCSNSTKTMHPYFLNIFQIALIKLGINIKIENPYLLKTKGEMLSECKNHDLIYELATKTLSCSHGGGHTKGWFRDSYNCGYCIPCTIRRASIHKFDNSLDVGTDYGHNTGNNEIFLTTKNDKKLDLLALSYFLNRDLDFFQLKREVKLMANIDNIDDITKMLIRGYSEIKEYINAKADSHITGLFH
jgi:7-cyano-7-deazaguanine synthase in queuosine biosynthesis